MTGKVQSPLNGADDCYWNVLESAWNSSTAIAGDSLSSFVFRLKIEQMMKMKRHFQ